MENNYNNYVWYEIFKKWLFFVLIATFLYILILIIFYDDTDYNGLNVDVFTNQRNDYLKAMTPAFPPPMVNFMDNSKVLNDKFFSIDQIT
jgi:hypothetical protein